MNIQKKISNIIGTFSGKFDADERAFAKVYPKIKDVEGFLKSPSQEKWFFKAARRAPKDAIIVEIGSFKGRSTVSFAFGCVDTSRHIYAIDLFEGDGQYYGDGDFQEIFNRNVKACALERYVTAIKNNSLKVAEKWDKPIDILFIDGSHEYEDVKADFYAFYPFVKKGGWIALHDIKGMWPGVTKFWNEILEIGLLTDIQTVYTLGAGRKKNG